MTKFRNDVLISRGIAPYRFMELYYFCLQYGTLKQPYRDMIEQSAVEAGAEFAPYLLLAVTQEYATYKVLSARGIPCGNKKYYRMRKDFYCRLDKKLKATSDTLVTVKR